jgi:hypothetical protein
VQWRGNSAVLRVAKKSAIHARPSVLIVFKANVNSRVHL